MNAEWHSLCRGRDFAADGEAVNVQLADQRKHRIFVEDRGEEYVLLGVVARPALVATLDDPLRVTWMRNRNSELVGFRIDGKGRLVGEAWVSKTGLTAEEFELYLRTLAVDCDRLENILTGKDLY